jgi:membrane protease YdiL (CAAX protease family)
MRSEATPYPAVLIPLLAFAITPFIAEFVNAKPIITLLAELMLGLPALLLCTSGYLRQLIAARDENWNRTRSLILIILLIPVGFHFLSGLIGSILPPSPAYTESMKSLLMEPGAIRYLSWFTLIVIAPFFEEFYFRGVLHDYFLSLGFLGALLLQATLFALLHSCLQIAPQLFILALALGWLRQRYQSLWPGIFAHAMINASALYMLIH